MGEKRLSFFGYPFLLFFLVSCSSGWQRVEERAWQPGQWTGPPASASPLKRSRKIVVDAGHGGKDLGAESKERPVCQEKTLNLATALSLSTFLERLGYQTILTRGADFFVPLDLRALFANGNEAELFVSVHYNSAPSPKAEGVEVYYYDDPENKGRSEASKLLAERVLAKIIRETGCKSRGVKHGNFAVIRETSMPAILVEGGFMTNEEELKKVRASGYQRALAAGIALGVHEYLRERGE